MRARRGQDISFQIRQCPTAILAAETPPSRSPAATQEARSGTRSRGAARHRKVTARKAEVGHWPAAALALTFHVMPNTSQHWRQRAQQARIRADHVRGPSAKVAMMSLAVSYEMLAVRAAMRELAEKLARYKDR